MLTIASLLFVSVLAVNAQVSSDTTSTGAGSTGQQPSVQDDQSQPSVTDDQSNYTRDMELIQSSEVPASLRSTLQGSEYTGWEQGKIYRNSTTNEYLIVVGEDDAKVYRFDSNGTRIENSQESSSDSNSSGSMDSGSSGSSSTSPGSTSGSTDSQSPSGSTPESTSGSSTSGSTSGSTTPESK